MSVARIACRIMAIGLFTAVAWADQFTNTPGTPVGTCANTTNFRIAEMSGESGELVSATIVLPAGCTLMPGVIGLREQAGQPAEKMQNGTNFSDVVTFAANGDITIDSRNDLPMLPAGFNCAAAGTVCIVEPQNQENGVERITYTAINGTNKNRVIYTILSDVPEPTSFFLFGSGLLGLGGILRKKLFG